MTPEQRIQREILHEFGTRPELRLWRANVGAAITHGGRVCRFGVRGQADLSGILRGGARLEIEVKAPGGVQSAVQRAYGAMILRYGGIYIVARSVEDVRAGLAGYLGGEGGGR
jgi:hypothetical protein